MPSILGYIYTPSDIFRSVWDRVHYGTDPLCSHGTGKKQERYSYIWNHLRKWNHLVLEGRSDPYRIHQVSCKHKAYPYQFRTCFERIRSCVNAALTFSLQFSMDYNENKVHLDQQYVTMPSTVLGDLREKIFKRA